MQITVLRILTAENISDHETEVGSGTSFPYLSENGDISKLSHGLGKTPVKTRNI